MFDKTVFTKTKPNLILINTARGGIINTLDLIDALQNGSVAAAGLDVYEGEKPIFFDDHSNSTMTDGVFLKLRSLPNVLITGHQAFLTHEALQGIAHTTIENLDGWQKNGVSIHELH